MLDDRLHIKLIDFGLARTTDDSNVAENYSFCGSPIYIAPETLLGAKYDKRADFYALGVLLYEMVIGFSPFNVKSADKMLLEKTKKEILFPSTISPSSKKLIQMLIKTDPHQRTTEIPELARYVSQHYNLQYDKIKSNRYSYILEE